MDYSNIYEQHPNLIPTGFDGHIYQLDSRENISCHDEEKNI